MEVGWYQYTYSGWSKGCSFVDSIACLVLLILLGDNLLLTITMAGARVGLLLGVLLILFSLILSDKGVVTCVGKVATSWRCSLQ